jgi:hypothetical protein
MNEKHNIAIVGAPGAGLETARANFHKLHLHDYQAENTAPIFSARVNLNGAPVDVAERAFRNKIGVASEDGTIIMDVTRTEDNDLILSLALSEALAQKIIESTMIPKSCSFIEAEDIVCAPEPKQALDDIMMKDVPMLPIDKQAWKKNLHNAPFPLKRRRKH